MKINSNLRKQFGEDPSCFFSSKTLITKNPTVILEIKIFHSFNTQI